MKQQQQRHIAPKFVILAVTPFLLVLIASLGFLVFRLFDTHIQLQLGSAPT